MDIHKIYTDIKQKLFQDDTGDWSSFDYAESAKHFFSNNFYFGESLDEYMQKLSFNLWEDSSVKKSFSKINLGLVKTVRVYKNNNNNVTLRGFVTLPELSQLKDQNPNFDFSNLHVVLQVPDTITSSNYKTASSNNRTMAPAILEDVVIKEKVDLRNHTSPVGDQGHTGRCSAFAWTHIIEMLDILRNKPNTRLSCSYTMLQFQKMQADAKNYKWAFSGGDGTMGTPDPGIVLVKNGTCQEQDFWLNDSDKPLKTAKEMAKNAKEHKLEGKLYTLGIDDLKKALSLGHIIHVGMLVGEAFSKVGKDGIIKSEDPPSYRGGHAMLVLGYFGNYFIIKNSWGTEWGDNGYCYIPKNLLDDARPHFVAVAP